mmetsp:Transcript_15063/g.60512  ORF Transcript_15063/g.60512 Transcript_15063/m.60512 type:complete len:220 (-) Transcript_15063:1141-1800(-)
MEAMPRRILRSSMMFSRKNSACVAPVPILTRYMASGPVAAALVTPFLAAEPPELVLWASSVASTRRLWYALRSWYMSSSLRSSPTQSTKSKSSWVRGCSPGDDPTLAGAGAGKVPFSGCGGLLLSAGAAVSEGGSERTTGIISEGTEDAARSTSSGAAAAASSRLGSELLRSTTTSAGRSSSSSERRAPSAVADPACLDDIGVCPSCASRWLLLLSPWS